MAFDVHVLLWQVFHAALLLALSRSACPEATNDETTPEIFVQHGKPTNFDCCASPNDSVTWSSNANRSWKKYPWWKERPKSVYVRRVNAASGTQNLVLHLKYPRRGVDSGKYKCLVTNNNTVVRERVFLVTVYDCKERDRPEVFDREPQQFLALGTRKTLTCEADFGCPDGAANQRQAYWKRGGVRMTDGSSAAFNVVPYRRKHNVIIGSNLTLNRPTADDIELPFECFLFDNASETLQWGIRFRPEPTVRPVPVVPKYWYGVVAILILLLLALVVVLYRLYGPKLYFLYKSKLCKKRPRFEGGCFNPKDVGILHGTESDDAGMTFAAIARSQLVRYGYTCSALDEVQGPRLTECGDILQNCSAVLVVFTAPTFQDPVVQLLVNAVLKEKRVVFGVLVNAADGSTPHLTAKEVKSKYNGLQVLKWPSNSRPTTKAVINFWYQVRTLLLPVPKTSSRSEHTATNECTFV